MSLDRQTKSLRATGRLWGFVDGLVGGWAEAECGSDTGSGGEKWSDEFVGLAFT
jgi:hypothetical protein